MYTNICSPRLLKPAKWFCSATNNKNQFGKSKSLTPTYRRSNSHSHTAQSHRGPDFSIFGVVFTFRKQTESQLTLIKFCSICRRTCISGAQNELKRERREIRRQAHCCNRVQNLHYATVWLRAEWEGAVSRVIRKPEDLPDICERQSGQ